jgi:hypothetical protein
MSRLGRHPVAPVYFAWHDAPVILYQAGSIAAFLSEVVRMSQPPHQSHAPTTNAPIDCQRGPSPILPGGVLPAA